MTATNGGQAERTLCCDTSLTEGMNLPDKRAFPLDPCRYKKHCHGAGEIDGQLRMPRFWFYRVASLAVGIAQPVSEAG